VTLAYGEVASADLSRVFVETADLFMVPEPTAAIGLVAGIIGLAGLTRRRRASQQFGYERSKMPL